MRLGDERAPQSSGTINSATNEVGIGNGAGGASAAWKIHWTPVDLPRSLAGDGVRARVVCLFVAWRFRCAVASRWVSLNQ